MTTKKSYRLVDHGRLGVALAHRAAAGDDRATIMVPANIVEIARAAMEIVGLAAGPELLFNAELKSVNAAMDAIVADPRSHWRRTPQSTTPAPLPQDVVDAMEQAAARCRDDIYRTLDSVSLESRPGAWSETDYDGGEVRDVELELVDLEFRLRKAIDVDFGHHAALRLKASEDRLAAATADIEAAA